MKKLILIIVALSLVIFAAQAKAATDTSSVTATATVAANCNVESVTNLDFGSYDPTSATADDDGAGDVSFRCTKGTAYNTYITGARTMTDGTDTLNFEVYQEAGRTTVYPNASPGSSGTAADNTVITSNLYGRIAALQDVQAGTYNGSVTFTVEY
jgi:spore coat protein U-like protein